jgi:hypothetical protein
VQLKLISLIGGVFPLRNCEEILRFWWDLELNLMGKDWSLNRNCGYLAAELKANI